MNFKNIFTVVALVVLALAIFLYITGKNNAGFEDNNIPPAPEEETVIPASEVMQPGEVGEIENTDNSEVVEDVSEVITEQDKLGSNVELPQEIFSTVGVVLEVRKDSLIINGDGNNFADNEQRELTVYLTEQTKTFSLDKTKHQGMAGLDVLKENMNILINSTENIRGKTHFTIKTISILN
jgi:hypothetical protein